MINPKINDFVRLKKDITDLQIGVAILNGISDFERDRIYRIESVHPSDVGFTLEGIEMPENFYFFAHFFDRVNCSPIINLELVKTLKDDWVDEVLDFNSNFSTDTKF